MFSVLDAPCADAPIDPARFQVRGWLWVGDAQPNVEAIEAWSGELLLGETTEFLARPDVNAALTLADKEKTGFDFFARALPSQARREIDLQLRVRWVDGSRTGPFGSVTVKILDLGMTVADFNARPPEPTHEVRVARWLPSKVHGGRDFGIEIGAFKTPIPGIRPLYFDRFPAYDYEKVSADYLADAGTLPIRSNALDYVANANVFEHLANPLKVLWEWARVTRDGGVIYLVIPDRRHTFDHPRKLTLPEHIVEDFDSNTTDSDGTHITDYIDGVDWALWAPASTPEERITTRETLRAAYAAAVAASQPINIHFHTFELSSFVDLLRLANRHPLRPCILELIDASEYFPKSQPSGFLVVLRVRKKFRERIAGWVLRHRARGDVRASLLPGATPFPSA